MKNPDECAHDFRRIFPRHITGQFQTDPHEKVLFVICCGCGKSPIYFMQLTGPKAKLPRFGEVNGEWPADLEIVEYEFDRGLGPSVVFRRSGEAQ